MKPIFFRTSRWPAGDSPFSSVPSTTMLPPCTERNVPIRVSSVVLPAPDGPVRITNSLRFSVKSMETRTGLLASGPKAKLASTTRTATSPSAEAVGHAPGQEVLQVGKEEVTIKEINPVGNYAIAPVFSDGHNSGIYTWDFLYKLGAEYPSLWADYLKNLDAAGYKRKEPLQN